MVMEGDGDKNIKSMDFSRVFIVMSKEKSSAFLLDA
jgi:hypothetical protein